MFVSLIPRREGGGECMHSFRSSSGGIVQNCYCSAVRLAMILITLYLGLKLGSHKL